MTDPTLVEEWAALTGQPATSNAMWQALRRGDLVAIAVCESRLSRTRDLTHARHLIGTLLDALRSALNALDHDNIYAARHVARQALDATELDQIFATQETT